MDTMLLNRSNSDIHHTFSVYVNNKPGVLMRITQIFARRGFNIDSLVVSQTRDTRYSRMTIGITGLPDEFKQILKQVPKLIDVIHCTEHTSNDAIIKEMLMIKFLADTEQRAEAFQIIEHFGGKTLDLTKNSMVAMFTGDTSKLDAAVSMLNSFEIVETVRTGKVVIARGEDPT